MGYLEAGQAIVYGRLVEGFRVPFARDEYYDLVIVPGFSDGHAHPQVVDAGLVPGVKWRNSYEWFEGRQLSVDEAAIRSDLRVASRLALLTFKRALLEGTTMIAVTGRLEANVRAWLSLPGRPRVVFLPTVMNRRGWMTVDQIAGIAERYSKYLDDGMARIGVFVHSLRYGKGMLASALKAARRLGSIVGIHISEGVREMHLLRREAGGPPYPARIVGVHCTEDEDPSLYGVTCIGCPYSNLILYGRTRKTLSGISGFGSDWPLLIGSVGSHMGLIGSIFGEGFVEAVKRATIGGYRSYGMRPQGDLVAFDGGLEALRRGRARPRLVAVNGKPVVVEGVLVYSGESLSDVLREIRSAVAEVKRMFPLNVDKAIRP